MSQFAIAFYIGLFGSIHCVGMCGPLAFAVPVMHNNKWLLVWDKLSYQVGRILSYALLGLLVGILGKQIWLLGAQRVLSFASGLLIVLAAIARWWKLSLIKSPKTNPVLAKISQAMVHALQQNWGHLAVGMLNGLLPCGFVYIALLGALNAGSVVAASAYMACFGLGTAPLMLAATVGSGFMSVGLRRRLNGVVPYFMLCLGFWFMLRSFSLNIPYLSPKPEIGTSECR